jgi:Tol biopolymer transport system component
MDLRRGTTIAAFAAVVAGLAYAPAATHATRRASNGIIAFSRYRYVNNPVRKEIWVVNPDGSGLRQVTHAPPNYLDFDPSWAPGGSRLVFSRCAPQGIAFCDGQQSVWTVKPDGTGLRDLTPPCRHAGKTFTPGPTCPQDGQAVFSPDGRRIALVRWAGRPAIAIGDSGLRHVHLFFPLGKTSGAPDEDALAWSPDGSQLAFSVHNDNGDSHLPADGRALYVMNADGSQVRRVTPWSLAAGGLGELAWSPDGGRILFRTVTATAEEPNLSTGDIYTIRPDGSGLQRLTHFPAGTGIQLGSYSPDGTKIVFATTNNATVGPDSFWPDLFTMNADGSDITPLTRTKNWEGTPDWGTG